MQTFLVTLFKGRNCLKTRCRAHKARSATIEAAKLNPGWVVVDVMAIGPVRGAPNQTRHRPGSRPTVRSSLPTTSVRTRASRQPC